MVRTPSPRRSKYCCPTCGHPVLPDDPLAILPMTQRVIFDVIYSAGQAGITREALHERVYGAAHNGAVSISIVSVQVNQINKKIKYLRMQIYAARGSGHAYRVRRLPQSLVERQEGEACASS